CLLLHYVLLQRAIFSLEGFHQVTMFTVSFSPQQSVLVMSVFAATLLAPAGWILHHIPKYRHRDAVHLPEDAVTSPPFRNCR
uniref:Uncharacterized protein n=1 Tax=Scleropages formosus TaxID=113540 RepID=A0A8C9RNN9_SCLFO